MLKGTAVHGTVRTVVWEDGGEIPLLPDTITAQAVIAAL
ncbi:hypothetical protein Pan110_02130 [Gimesia panareensis]|nr:hypothetical protein Pan110_02130 [Gimesia panareensis]